MKEIYDWGANSFLNFNVKKTQAIHFFNPKELREPKIIMNDKEISPEKFVKYLGIWFDSSLTFEEHFNRIIDKGKKAFNITRSYCGRTWGINPYLTRLVYNTTIIPILTYGASITHVALKNKKTSEKIRTFQYNCTKSIIKSYRTISIATASILSNTLPLKLEIYKRGQIELARITGEINDRIINNSLIDTQSYKPSYNNLSDTNMFLKEDNIVELEKTNINNFNRSKKLTIEPKINWSDLPIGEDKILLTEVDNYLNTEDDYTIYTDGSKINNYGTGGSFEVHSRATIIARRSFPLHPHCSVSQAEMLSIFKGLNWAFENLELTDCSILICTDSLSSIQNLRKTYNSDLIPYFINKLLLELRQINCIVRISKVKAHSRIIGNENADQLAKKGAKKSSRFPNSNLNLELDYLPLSSIKKSITDQCTKAWLASTYDVKFIDDRAKLNEWTKLFLPNPESIKMNLLDICDFHTTQVITGHGSFKAYLHKFHITKDNLCITCRNDNLELEDTPEHALFYCKKSQAKNLLELNINHPKELFKFMKDEKKIKTFKEICREMIIRRDDLIQSEIKKSDAKTKKDIKNRKTKPNPEHKVKPKTKPKTTMSKSEYKISSGAVISSRTAMTNPLFNITRDSWLTDDQINCCAERLCNTSNNRNKFIIISPLIQDNPLTMAKLLNNELSEKTEIIISIMNVNNNSHWVLGLINIRGNKICLIDSNKPANTPYLPELTFKRLLLIKILVDLILKKTFLAPSFLLPSNNPQQMNNNDCGVFVCKHIENLVNKVPDTFSISTGDFRDNILGHLTNRADDSIEPIRRKRLEKSIQDYIKEERYTQFISNAEIAPTWEDYENMMKSIL